MKSYKNHRPSFRNPVLKAGLLLVLATFLIVINTMAQQTNQMVRMAKIKVDPSRLEQYHAALKEQMMAAIRLEPGVLSYYAVAEKKDPSSITILEVYADTAAYQSHINTAHFRKYKEAVKGIVQQLELVDLNLVEAVKKPNF